MVLIAGLAVINISSMANCESEDDEFIILDVANETIVADAVTPLAFSVGGECLAVLAWVFTVRKIFINPRCKHLLCVTV